MVHEDVLVGSESSVELLAELQAGMRHRAAEVLPRKRQGFEAAAGERHTLRRDEVPCRTLPGSARGGGPRFPRRRSATVELDSGTTTATDVTAASGSQALENLHAHVSSVRASSREPMSSGSRARATLECPHHSPSNSARSIDRNRNRLCSALIITTFETWIP